MPEKSRQKVKFVSDDKAESLEKAGLWRRAAARWLTVFDEHPSEIEREWLSERRDTCLRKSQRPPVLLDSFGDVRRAADRTEKEMGLDKLSDKALNLYPE